MDEGGNTLRFEYSVVGRALAIDSYRLFDAIIRGEVRIRSEFPEVGRVIARYLCWRFGAKIIGAENIPSSGGVLLIGNHLQVFDGTLGTHGPQPREVKLVVKNDGENRLGLRLLRLLTGAITMSRNTGDLEAVRMIESILEQKGVVCMFPEGHRPEDGKMRGFHPGIAVIARHVPSAKIVPFGITNASHLTFGTVVKNLDRGISIKGKRPTIRFGKPFQLPTERFPKSKREQRYADVAFIRQRVLDLLPPYMEGPNELFVREREASQ